MHEQQHSGTVILNAKRLQLGMYVSYLDRPWTETSFLFQGFKIQDEKELRQIQESCEYVYVDSERSTNELSYADYYGRRQDGPDQKKGGFFTPSTKRIYKDACTPETEFPAARQAYADLRKAVTGVYDAARRDPDVNLDALARVTGPVVDSVQRSPDAIIYLIRTGAAGDYLYRHALACAVMCCSMGRYLGLPREMLEALTMGGAMLAIGKTRIPSDLLNRPDTLALTPAELERIRLHVALGVEIVRCADADNQLVAMLGTYRERHNGSGYPNGLSGNKISPVGQIAAVVDMYDAMVSERKYGRRATPFEAMSFIRKQAGEDFDRPLVKAFTTAFGPYPTGSLVELSNGSVGFVIQQNREVPASPRVYLVLDATKQRLHEFKTISLADVDETGSPASVQIVRCLSSGTHGIEF